MKNEIKNDETFRVKNFKTFEMNANNGIASYLKCFEYDKLVEAVQDNDKHKIRVLENKLKIYQMKLSDFSLKNNEWINGKPYVSPLRLSMELRSFSAFQYLLDDLIASQSINSVEFTMERIKTSKIRLKSAKSQNCLNIRNYLISIREYAEQNEIYEVIDILDNLGEDDEIKAALDEEHLFGKTRKSTVKTTKGPTNQKFLVKYKENLNSESGNFFIKEISAETATKINSQTSKRSISSISQMCAII